MKEEELSEIGLRIWEEYIDRLKTVQEDSGFTEEENEKPLPEVTWVDEPITEVDLKEKKDEQVRDTN